MDVKARMRQILVNEGERAFHKYNRKLIKEALNNDNT